MRLDDFIEQEKQRDPEFAKAYDAETARRAAIAGAEQGMWDAFAEEERIKQEMAAMGKANGETPRERIADVVLDIARVAVANYRNLGYEYMSREDAEDFEHEVNKIIAIVREVLLQPEVVEAARDAVEAEVYAASLPGGRFSEKSLARAALKAALGDDMTEGNHNDR